MRTPLQLATAVLAISTALAPPAHAQFHFPGTGKSKQDRPRGYDFEWMWQYGPPPAGGRESELIRDAHFRPMLDQYFTAPQAFWGTSLEKKQRSLADTILDHLSVPASVIADDERYLSVTGCVVHFCPARGLMWVDLNSPRPFLVFAAVDWTKDSKPTTDPDAEYTLWIFSNRLLTTGGVTPAAVSPDVAPTAKNAAAASEAGPTRMPAALLRSIGRFAATPVPGSTSPQKITSTILVDPDGTPHPLAPAAVGIHPE